ncbi:MAG: VIT and VWA domain-containing protein [Desulfovibrio sp.]|nr:VIT and VWA domain-containing protein [Desulfovibrio sp.]
MSVYTFPGSYPPGSPGRLNQALIAQGALGSYIWNSPSPHFDTLDAICPQKDAPARGFLSAPAISFKSMRINGRVGPRSCSWTMTQTWKNDSPVGIEAIYTFPAPAGTVITGLKAFFNKREALSRAVPVREAEETYEKAVTQGNLAIMLQKSSFGLYTINLGIIPSGERLSAVLSCAQLTPWDGERIRFVIPLVISNRFGDGKKYLKPREKIFADSAARFSAFVHFNISSELGDAKVYVPGLEYALTEAPDGKKLSLSLPMNRDLIVNLEVPEPERPPVYIRGDRDFFIVAAAKKPKALPRRPLSVHILLDCSGSMSGPRVALAKKALTNFADLLEPEDRFLFSRFGSRLERVGSNFRQASPFNLSRLRKAAKSSYAELGATRLDEALSSVASSASGDRPFDVLLVTDGNVWSADRAIQLARAADVRVFCLAIGFAPNLPLLEKIAVETGGACFSLAPGENIAAITNRLREYMDEKPWEKSAANLPVPVSWRSSNIPSHEIAYGKADYKDETYISAKFQAWNPAVDPELNKIAASFLLKSIQDKRLALEIAMEYQILSDETSFILEFEASGIADEFPRVEYVPQMIPEDQILFESIRLTPVSKFDLARISGVKKAAASLKEFIVADFAPSPDRASRRYSPTITATRFLRTWLESAAQSPLLSFSRISELDILSLLSRLNEKYGVDERNLIIYFARWLIDYGLEYTAQPARHIKRLFSTINLTEEEKEMLAEEFEEWVNC